MWWTSINSDNFKFSKTDWKSVRYLQSQRLKGHTSKRKKTAKKMFYHFGNNVRAPKFPSKRTWNYIPETARIHALEVIHLAGNERQTRRNRNRHRNLNLSNTSSYVYVRLLTNIREGRKRWSNLESNGVQYFFLLCLLKKKRSGPSGFDFPYLLLCGRVWEKEEIILGMEKQWLSMLFLWNGVCKKKIEFHFAICCRKSGAHCRELLSVRESLRRKPTT